MENYGTRALEDLETRSQAESVVERMYRAVESLCTGQGDVRNRLIIAIELLLPLDEREFPECIRCDFVWVLKQATKFESVYPEHIGRLQATMRRIKNSTGEKIALRIFEMYSKIQDIRGFPLLEYRHPQD